MSVAQDYTPRRMVSLQPSATLILRDLGKLDLPIACTKYCAEACSEVTARGIAIVSDSWTAQSEQIRALQPDFVIASVPYQEKSVIEILKASKGRRNHSPNANGNRSRPPPLANASQTKSLLRRVAKAADRFAEMGRRAD
jgi:ABC-type hemin transport system substrate-binding protein